jgi:hypothetical protein
MKNMAFAAKPITFATAAILRTKPLLVKRDTVGIVGQHDNKLSFRNSESAASRN